MTFRVGQKVVCVNDGRFSIRWRISLWWHGVVRPKIGFIGTVCNVYHHDDDEMIELTELPSPEAGPWLTGYLASCFRPLVDRPTDISVFTKVLKPTDRKVDA